MLPKGFLRGEDVAVLTRQEMIETHVKHGNSGLAGLLGHLDFNRLYVRAQGTRVWDDQGQEYLDFLGSYGAMNLGHNHPQVLEALDKVREKPNFLQASLSTYAGALAQNLALLAPGDLNRTFFCNSGAEAVEAAMKTARIATGRTKFLYTHGGFHGKSMGALTLTGREKYQKPFEPLIPGANGVPYGEIGPLAQALESGEYAGFIIEPIQGEGGVRVPPTGYLAQVAQVCQKTGTLLIVDEIQTGLGRTGTLFASEYEKIQPDLLLLAKSLGGGIMPIGAMMTTDAIWQKAYGGMEKCLLHTSTFGGGTWAAAAGIAALEVTLNEDLPAQAKQKGDLLLSGLRDLAQKYGMIEDVRGRGLLIGIEFKSQGGFLDKVSGGQLGKLSQEYIGALIAGELLKTHHIITAYTLNNPNVIRMEPPLTVTEAEIKQVLGALDDCLSRHKGLFSLAASATKTVVQGLFRR